MAIILSGTTGIDAGSLPVSNCGNTEVEGNLNLSGVGARITGDFSNGTVSNRVLFQTNTANSNTTVAAVPNGTATTSVFSAYSGTDIDNSSSMSILCTTGDSSLRASRNGTGTYTPMTFYTNGSEKMRIDTAGNVGVGTTTPARKLEVQSYGVGAAGILRISGLAGSGSTTNASLLELSITGAGGGTVTQNLTARYNNGYEIATYFADRVSWRDNATNTQLFAIDSSGNALVTNSTGGLGYGTGAGGTVTQLTNKNTAVTLNKPCGTITCSNSSLGANSHGTFLLYNSLIQAGDQLLVNMVYGTGTANVYTITSEVGSSGGVAAIGLWNFNQSTAFSEAIQIRFSLIKGAIA